MNGVFKLSMAEIALEEETGIPWERINDGFKCDGTPLSNKDCYSCPGKIKAKL